VTIQRKSSFRRALIQKKLKTLTEFLKQMNQCVNFGSQPISPHDQPLTQAPGQNRCPLLMCLSTKHTQLM
jgi:hypothetical protein